MIAQSLYTNGNVKCPKWNGEGNSDLPGKPYDLHAIYILSIDNLKIK